MSAIDCVESDCFRLLKKRMKRFVRAEALGDPLERESLGTYTDGLSFSCTYLLHNLLKKSKRGGDNKKCTEAAISLWYEAEQMCLATNLRFGSITSSPDLIVRIREKILDTIGHEPHMPSIADLCKWGPGSTFDIRRKEATVAKKHTSVLSATSDCVPHLMEIFDLHWLRAQRSLYPRVKVVRGNRCVTVPKDAKKHRMIACEPTGNGFLQSGVGRFFRGALKREGVDLSDQSVNQELASICQKWGLSTIDLSMASDTLSRSVVDYLLPPRWVSFLNEIRSPFSRLNGKWVRLEKFSSMGNGFTFELESLIFWAICSVASSTGFASVYGDDIIVTQDSYDEVVAALRFFGFTPNPDKSYHISEYYESCGKHYYNGVDVTPAYQKEVVDSLAEAIRFHNRLFRWGLRNNCLHLVKDACNLIKRRSSHWLQGKHTLRVPWDFPGDFGFLDENLEFVETTKYRVLVEKSQLRRGTGYEDAGFYAFKMRAPHLHSNARPDGHSGVVKKTSYVFQKRRFWHSSRELKYSLSLV